MVRDESRLPNRGTVETLKTFAKHGSVVLLAKPPRNMHTSAWVNAEEIAVVREMMDRAERQPVHHRGNALWRRVGDDVSCLHQLALSKGADGAAVLICTEDFMSKALLMESSSHHAEGV